MIGLSVYLRMNRDVFKMVIFFLIWKVLLMVVEVGEKIDEFKVVVSEFKIKIDVMIIFFLRG